MNSDQIAAAISAVRSQVRWKSGSAMRHLLKRKLRGHLPMGATIDDYESIIRAVLQDTNAQVCLYWHDDTSYVAVSAVLGEDHWLVMFDADGVMESAFVVDRPSRYLNKQAFKPIGSLLEVLG
jgi:hypothetical protein